MTTLLFLKKKNETGPVEDDFTYNVVLHHDDLTLFDKKKINEPIFTNFTSNRPLNTKKPFLNNDSNLILISW